MSSGRDLISAAIAAYNSGDIEGYFALHSASTELHHPPAAPANADDYRAQFVATRARWQSLTVRIIRLHEAGPVVVMESTVDFGDGRAPYPEAVIFELDHDGVIHRTRVYSSAPIGSQLT